MTIMKTNSQYEDWLRTQCQVVEADLKTKRKLMKTSAFAFLRGTYFRWAGKIEEICPELSDAPAVLSVGDSHVENFGTWRDAEGRLVWGVNDFDEATMLPYAYDLVRLAASACLAPKARLSYGDAADAILEGYRRGLSDPRPTLLDEQETWMRPFVNCTDEERDKFWAKLAAIEPVELASDQPGRIALQAGLPAGTTPKRIVPTVKGCGSLGRPRYAATAGWCGGHIVREAKALIPSAWDWVHERGKALTSRYLEIPYGRHRAPDPTLMLSSGFIVRRVAADARRVELGPEAGRQLGRRLLGAMGADLASIHSAEPGAASVNADFEHRKPNWLRGAGRAAADWVERDYEKWHANG